MNPDSSAPTLLHAAEIRRRGIFRGCGLLLLERRAEPARRALLLSRSGDPRRLRRSEFHQRRLFHAHGHSAGTGIDRTGNRHAPSGQIWKYCEPVGNHAADDGAASATRPRSRAGSPEARDQLCSSSDTEPSLNDNSAVAAKQQVEKIRALDRYAAVLNVYMEEAAARLGLAEPDARPETWWSFHFSFPTDCTATKTFRRCSGSSAPSKEFSGNPHQLHGRSLFYSPARSEPIQVCRRDYRTGRGLRSKRLRSASGLAKFSRLKCNPRDERRIVQEAPGTRRVYPGRGAGARQLMHMAEMIRTACDYRWVGIYKIDAANS